MTGSDDAADALWLTALHEAGHAVLAVVFDLPLRRVVLVSSDRAWCNVDEPSVELESVEANIAHLDAEDVTCRPAHIPAAWNLPAYLVMLESGEAAACRVRGRRSDGGWADRFTGEQLVARVLRRPPYGREVQAFLSAVATAADAEVGRRWAWITATARELVVKRQMTGDEVKGLRPAGGRR